jgi:hypothetical protein
LHRPHHEIEAKAEEGAAPQALRNQIFRHLDRKYDQQGDDEKGAHGDERAPDIAVRHYDRGDDRQTVSGHGYLI